MSNFPPDLDHDIPQAGTHLDIIYEGPFATVARTWMVMQDGQPQVVAVKSSSTLRKFSREPHDIIKESRLLSSIQHPNIVSVIDSFMDEAQASLDIYMPFLAISLSDLLSSPSFSPHPFLQEDNVRHTSGKLFSVISRSIMIQTLFALAFLHQDHKIAHRDIKPGNIMFSEEGCVKLIDFGVAYEDRDVEKRGDLWPECKDNLYFEVSTQAYRAPELLFGARNYDPISIDLWSLGVSFTEFFTALRLCSKDVDHCDEDGNNEDPLQPFIIPKHLRVGYPDLHWKRDTLFNGDAGEIGLAWSIFKVFGTPTSSTWPEFELLPGVKSIVFNVVPGVPLSSLLPNLPPSPRRSKASSAQAEQSLIVELLLQFLRYPYSSRLSAEEALKHPWFTDLDADEEFLLLPEGYICNRENLIHLIRYEYKGKALSQLVKSLLQDSHEDEYLEQPVV